MDKMENLLQVKELKTHFMTMNGVVPSVNGVTFNIKKGEKVALVGESGSGKSVTSLSIMGLIEEPGKIVNGSIIFDERNLVDLREKEMEKIRGNDIAMIFQEPLTSLNPLFPVGKQIRESLLLHQKITRKEAKQRAIELLKKVGIPMPEQVYSSYPHSLSGGMRQRVMIAIALSCEPKLIIADEPTTALDVTIQAQILGILNELSELENTALLIITHDLGVVAEIADRVMVMYCGQIVEEADVFSIFDSPLHPYTEALLKSTPRLNGQEKLASIEGRVPNPLHMPKGCTFHTRCPYAIEKCSSNVPAIQEFRPNHHVRCWLADEEEGGIKIG